MHTQTLQTNFSPDTRESRETQLRRIMSTSDGVWYWESYQNAYPESFQKEIEKIHNGITYQNLQRRVLIGVAQKCPTKKKYLAY